MNKSYYYSITYRFNFPYLRNIVIKLRNNRTVNYMLAMLQYKRDIVAYSLNLTAIYFRRNNMKFTKTIKLVSMALVILMLCVGCNNADSPSSNEGQGKVETSANSNGHRKPYETEKTDYEDNDGKFDYKTEKWDGPNGYVIVVPAGNSANKKTAELLKSYFKDKLNVSVSVVTDKNPETEKEILIGKTSRKQSDSSITESDICVSLKDNKLVIDGGHDVTIDSAVKKYIRLAPKANEAFTFKIETDFKSTLEKGYNDKGDYEGYKYVWGDEFEGDGLDSSKWSLINKMAGNEQVEVSYDKDCIDVNEGRLKMHAISYFNNNREGTEYRVPCSIVTQDTMNWVYGYIEIRARVPYKQGVWASWWTQTTDALKGKGSINKVYMLEVDIYEIFNTYQKTSNLIHWPATGGGPAYYPNVNENPQAYVFPEGNKASWEYHTYGYYWSPTEIIMTIDGKAHTVFDTTKEWEKTYNTDMASYKDPQFVIFNNHLFYPGVSTASMSISTSPESLPACHYVDYIRLYQRPGLGEFYVAK